MWRQTELADTHFSALRKLKQLIDHGQITFGGNKKLKVYGRLHCASGKRTNAVNRVFFSSANQALAAGFRPCGHCMQSEYLLWKAESLK